MRTWTQTHHEGTDMGPVEDWSHEFVQRALERNEGLTLETLKDMAANPENYLVSDYGGWPRFWRGVIAVRLYDGWPYWKVAPAVLTEGPLGGGEWMWMDSLTGVSRRTR